MTATALPILAITMGDPAGIGSEIAVKALLEQEMYDICRPLVVGDLTMMQDAARMCESDVKFNAVGNPEDGVYKLGTIDVFDMGIMKLEDLAYKTVTAKQGDAGFQYVCKAIELAMEKKVHGTVTGPINKESMNMGGHHYSGHTEIYADKTNTKDYSMMLADHEFRVVHVSTHVSLRDACDRVKTPRVLRVIELADEAVKQLGIEAPRIGVCGLNPHCGEARMFGTEDEDEILPAVEQAKAQGIDADGPVPADTIFSKMAGGMYDMVVTMYHDQGHIPIKVHGFEESVSVNLGLPFLRTSVDHGTAFDIAGQNRAQATSMVEAIKLAIALATGRSISSG